MLDKYIKINEKVIESKQTSSGIWYCSSVTAETTKEMDQLIGQLNSIYNKYNNPIKNKKSTPDPEKNKKVKGLD